MISRWLQMVAQPGVFLIGFLVFLVILERRFPLRRAKRPIAGRLVVNLTITALALATASLTVKPAVMAAARLNAQSPTGLLNALPLPFMGKFLVGFLLMDFSFYLWHRANHEIPLLWRFHNVHHADPDLDISTSFRFHFVEIGISTGFRVVQMFAIGVTPVLMVTYETVFFAATMFHHSNTRMPIEFERILNCVFVTPRMHAIHHRAIKDETNSNYSVVLSWWDRLATSLCLGIEQEEIVVGVPAYMRPEENGAANLAALPFRRQKNYWTWPSGKASGRTTSTAKPENTMME